MPSNTEQAYLRLAARQRNAGTSRKPQLPSTSLEARDAINQYGEGVDTVLRIGQQFDGTHLAASLAGPNPPVPSGATITAGPRSITARWNGTFVDGALSPMDFKQVEVVAETDITPAKIHAVLNGELGTEQVISPLPQVEHRVWLQARTLAGKVSAPSAVVTVTPEPPVQIINEDGSTATQIDDAESFLTFGGASITPAGEAAFTGLSVDSDPSVNGKPLLGELATYEPETPYPMPGQLDFMPRGTIKWATRPIASMNIWNGTEKAILEVAFQKVKGRAYEFVIQPFGVYIRQYLYLICRFEGGGARPTLDSPIWARIPVNMSNATDSDGAQDQIMVTLGGSIIMPATVTEKCRLLFTLHNPYLVNNYRATVFAGSDGSEFKAIVKDIGMNVPDTGIVRMDERTETGGEGGNSEPPPPPEETNYTRTWNAAQTESYQGNGNPYNFDNSKLFQGQSPVGSVGDTRAIITFPDLTGELSGATITSMEVYLYYDHWWYARGGTANVGLHGYPSIPGQLGDGGVNNRIGSFHFNRNQGRWLDIPSAYWHEVKTGVYKGITIQGAGIDDYGYADAFGSRQPKIRVKYKK